MSAWVKTAVVVGPSIAHGLAPRAAARIIPACADGHDNKVVAKRLRMSQVPVCKWRGRFVRERVDGLCDEPRPGTPRRISGDGVADAERRAEHPITSFSPDSGRRSARPDAAALPEPSGELRNHLRADSEAESCRPVDASTRSFALGVTSFAATALSMAA